jgi:O-antigen/teichoic acid export membrane protein
MIEKSAPTLARSHAAFSMMMLYAGKTSGILVSLVFLPIYSLTLGTEAFGAVAVILSLQALLIMLDLGMSTIVGRDIAANESSPSKHLKTIFSAELGLLLFYGALILLIGMLVIAGVGLGVSPFIALALVIMFMLLVLQNLYYSAIVAKKAYTTASALLVAGNFVRGGGTAFVLTHISPTLAAFVASQIAGSLLQSITLRYVCVHIFKDDPHFEAPTKEAKPWHSALVLLHRARPLALLSAAGALVMQLDKTIISLFMTPSSVAPYFLAMTYCLVPMSVLAAPVAQFFQPRVIDAIAAGNAKRTSQVMRIYTAILLTITLLPSAMTYQFCDQLIALWLSNGPLVNITIDYVQILLPGLTIGALGYIPYSLLLSTSDYKFMAVASIIMTTITLLATVVAASQESVFLVCATYTTYHAFSTLLQWIRASRRQQTRKVAISSALATGQTLLFVGIILITISN